MKKINDNLNYFNTLSDFIFSLKTNEPLKIRNNSSVTNSYGFSQTNSINEAFELLEKKDTSIFDKKELDKLISKNYDTKITKNKYENSVVGFIPNVPNFCLGTPNTMITIKQDIKKVKIINIVINSCVGGGINKNSIQKKFSEILNDIILLEKKGYRVNIYLLIGTINGNTENTLKYNLGIVKVKKDSEPIDLKKLVFPLVHPSFLRRFIFRYLETFGTNDFTYSGYGRPLFINRDDFNEKQHLKKEDTIYNEILKELHLDDNTKYISMYNYDSEWTKNL